MSYSTATSRWLVGLNVKHPRNPRVPALSGTSRAPGMCWMLASMGVSSGLGSPGPRTLPAGEHGAGWHCPHWGLGTSVPETWLSAQRPQGRVGFGGAGGQASRSHPRSCQVGGGRGATEGGAVAGGWRAQQELRSQDPGALSSSDGGVEGLGRTKQGSEQVRVKVCSCCIAEPVLGTGRQGRPLQPRAGVDLAVAGSRDSRGDGPRRPLRGRTKQAGWGVRGGLCCSRTGVGGGGVRAGNQLGALSSVLSDTTTTLCCDFGSFDLWMYPHRLKIVMGT